MSCLSDLMQSCPNLQGDINNYWNTCGGSTPRENMPFYEWLTSPVNQSNLQSAISPGNGKIRKVNVTYQKRILESEVATDQANPQCEATSKRGQCIAEYELDTTSNVQAEESVSINDLAAACVSNPEYFQGILLRLMDAVRRKDATKSTVAAAALYGAWATDVAVTSDELVVNTLKTGDATTLAPFTMENIDFAMMKTGYCDGAFIAGDVELFQYYRRLLAGCCATSGVDLGEIMRLYGKAVAYDRRMVAALGATKSLVVQNGALAHLHYVGAAWKNGVPGWVTEGSNYLWAVVIDPITGVPYDLTVKDDCGAISIALTATTKVVAMPADRFASGDVFEGVTFVNKIKVSNS